MPISLVPPPTPHLLFIGEFAHNLNRRKQFAHCLSATLTQIPTYLRSREHQTANVRWWTWVFGNVQLCKCYVMPVFFTLYMLQLCQQNI